MDNFIHSFWDEMIIPLLLMFFKKNIDSLRTPHYYQNKAKYERVEKMLVGK